MLNAQTRAFLGRGNLARVAHQCSLGIVVGTSFFACPVALASDLEPLDSVNGLKFIQSTDWEYQALQSLAQSHNCRIGLPTDHNSRPLSRYEFALGLNECLQQIKPFALSPEDLITLQKLQQYFAPELEQLTTKAEPLQANIPQLESQQFSTKTKLIRQENNKDLQEINPFSLSQEDLLNLQKSQQNSAPELEQLTTKAEPLQANIPQLELPQFSTKPKLIRLENRDIESEFGQIDSVSTDITDIHVGSVGIKADAVKSELDLDSQDLKTELTLLSQSGFKIKMTKEFQNRAWKLKIGPVVSFKKSLNWLQEQSKTETKDKKDPLQQATRFPIKRTLTLNPAYLNSLRINHGNEIDDSSKDIRNLTKSLNSLTTSQFATNTTFSFEGDLEELSAKLEFPIPGILRNELELKIEINLPEVLMDGEDLQDNMESTLSLRYRIGINDATKLEIQSSYDLQTKRRSHRIIFELF